MPAAPLLPTEDERLAALADLNLAGSPSELAFDVFPLLASKVFDTPTAAITLIDHDTQWFKAGVGLPGGSVPRTHSLCEYALLQPNDVLHIPDTAADPRVCDNPAVVQPDGIRSYAGIAIAGPSGHPLGALCVADKVPRSFTRDELERLRYMAVGVEGAIKLHSAEEEQRRRTMTDPLTGVGNRLSFEECLAQHVETCGRDPAHRIALLSIDLDEFKSINDLFGHGGGDLALVETAKRLSGAVRSGDSVYRIGGDEFCVILTLSGDALGAQIVAHRLQAAFARRFCLGQQQIPLRVSIGAAIFPGDGTCAETLVRRADVALYEAKCSGGGTTVFARSEPSHPPRSLGRQEMRRELYAALSPPGNEPFQLAMQPIVRAGSGELAGFEALVRWPREDGTVMSPGDFIPAAEATGLVVQLDHWVMNRAIQKVASLPRHLSISCNVSAADFLSGHLVADICRALDRHNVEPERVKLEITETILLRDAKRVRSMILDLREMGIDVILDDFGTGKASIAYLRDYPFNGLKIDRSFVSHLEADPRRRIFVKAMLDMARALNITVTAEGVETPGQLRLLRRSKVDLVQGYLTGRPMPEDTVDEYVSRTPAGVARAQQSSVDA